MNFQEHKYLLNHIKLELEQIGYDKHEYGGKESGKIQLYERVCHAEEELDNFLNQLN